MSQESSPAAAQQEGYSKEGYLKWEINDEVARGEKRAIFLPWFGRRSGLSVPFKMSKIACFFLTPRYRWMHQWDTFKQMWKTDHNLSKQDRKLRLSV